MICVTIGRGRHKMMMAEHRHLAEEQGVKLVELRVDCIRSRLDIKRLLSDRPCPCIITCRRQEDGGQWSGTEEARIMALRTAIAEGADYVDLEEDIASDIPRFGPTKRIISYHNFRDASDDLEAIHERMLSLDPDIVKIAAMTHRPSDNLRMMHLVKRSKVPTVGICMGEIGIPTRILAGKFGAPFSYAAFHHERAMEPGQLSYTQMRDIYHYESINADTEVYGVIADPVGNDLSPVVHNAAFAEHKLDKVYVPFRVPRDDLHSFMNACPELGVKGLSVTIPHKDEVVRHLSKGDGTVRGIGSANTVMFEGDQTVGYNTEYRAFSEALDTVFADHEQGMNLPGRIVLVLGSGTLSRAIAFALKRREADVVLTSRNHERAGVLAERFRCRTIQWYERTKIEPDILINTTPIGMHPNVNEAPFDRKYIQRSTIVVETIQSPEQTLLIKEAREQGCRVVTGVDVFVRQAAHQFERFAGQKPSLELMRNEFKRHLGPAKW